MNKIYDLRVDFVYNGLRQTWLFTELTTKKKRRIKTAFNMMSEIGVFPILHYKETILWEEEDNGDQNS